MVFVAGQKLGASDLNNLTTAGYVVGRNRRTTAITTTASTQATAQRILSTIASVTTGRSYRISYQGEHFSATVPTSTQVELRITTDNTEPTTSSTQIERSILNHEVANVPDTTHISILYPATATVTLRVVATFFRAVGGAGTMSATSAATSPCEIVIEDCGPTVTVSGTVY